MQQQTFDNLFKLILFLNILIFVNCLEKARYDNYRVYNILVENQEQLKFLNGIEIYPDGYQFIDHPLSINRNAKLIVPPHKFTKFGEKIENLHLKATILVSNLQEVIDEEERSNLKRSNHLDWTRYWQLNEIHLWLKQLATVYPNDIELINIGKSYEGRDILGIKFNKRKESGKKQIVFEGTMHAREWISAATITWMLNELLTSKDPLIKELVATYEWNIIPVVNVDGYEYSWTSDRMWRKNRRPVNEQCIGIDLNRNFDIYFNQTFALPCGINYPGSHPFSETETKQYSKFLENLDNLVAFFSFHSYSQLLVIPYGYTIDSPDNYNELIEIGLKAIKSLSTRFGTQYAVGSISELFDILSGSSLDWVKDALNPNLTYAYELRDTGEYGFFLPASQIIENSLEVFDSIVTIMKESQKRGLA